VSHFTQQLDLAECALGVDGVLKRPPDLLDGHVPPLVSGGVPRVERVTHHAIGP
jgi:hypothetical protein